MKKEFADRFPGGHFDWGLRLFAFICAAAALEAQTVPVAVSGVISITGGPPAYSGAYVIQQTDFGFLWLDSNTLSTGHQQLEAHCGVGQPAPITGIRVKGDCNGISDVVVSSTRVAVHQYSGQCGAAQIGCPGPQAQGTGTFLFELGTFAYLGHDVGEAFPVSTQATDPQGRTWSVLQVTPFDQKHFAWTATGGGGPAWTPTTATVPVTGSPSPSPTQTVPTPTPCSGTIIVMGRCYRCDGTEISCPTTPTAGPSRTRTVTVSPVSPSPTPPRLCGDDLTLSGRFCIKATWRKSNGQTGVGAPLRVTADTGAFSFFAADNLEVFVKTLDACAVNGKRWVFASGATNVGVVLSVTDTVPNPRQTRTYTNPVGTTFVTVTDTQAFPCE